MNLSNILKKQLIPFVFLLFLTLVACEQTYTLDLPLAVTQTSLKLDAANGQTHVQIYATGDWKVSFEEETPWASIEKSKGNGNGEFIFNYEINPGIVRQANLIIQSGSKQQTITMVQSGFVSEAEITLRKQDIVLPSWNSPIGVGLATNMELALERIEPSVTYLDESGETLEADPQAEPWISEIRVQADSVYFTVNANPSNESRFAELKLTINDPVNKRVYSTSAQIEQTSEEGVMQFSETQIEVESFEKNNSAKWTTNLEMLFNQIEASVTYDNSGEEWLSNFSYTSDNVSFDTAENTTTGIRTATLTLTYNDALGHQLTTSQKITQARPAREIPYSELRALLSSAGSVELESDFITGIVIGEGGNPNMEVNPNTDYNVIDYTVNDKINYIEDAEGKYGFRLQAALSDDNSLSRYSTVKIALAGLTLTREDNPVRYTLSGFTTANLLESTTGTMTTPANKVKKISELTDDDLYTFVSLSDIEIASSLGSYTNVHDGYLLKTALNTVGRTAPVADCIPRLLRDAEGSLINMLFNTKTTWRRGSAVPRGSGFVNGILVHSTNSRYGKKGDIGRYQLRPVSEDDVVLKQSVEDGYSATIAEWDWNTTHATNINGNNQIPAHTGAGYIYSSVPTMAAMTPGFAGTTYANNVSNGALRYNAKWWNFTTDQGEWVSFNFSTKNINSKNLALIFTCGLGNQGNTSCFIPTFWNVNYSTDGTTFTTLKQLTIHPIIISASKGQFCCPGLMEFAIELPDALFDQDLVTIRLQAASPVCSTINGTEDDGVLTSSTIQSLYLRFGAASIKYNK